MVKCFPFCLLILLLTGYLISGCGHAPVQPAPVPVRDTPGFSDIDDSIRNQDPVLALRHYDSIISNDTGAYEALYEKGLLLEQLKDTAQAIEVLKKAYLHQPLNTYALELAHLYAELGNPLSLLICDQVIARKNDASLTDPYFIKGIYYSNTRQFPLAIVQFDSCIQQDWKFSDAYLEKGIALFKLGNFAASINTFRLAATVSNTDADAYYWMGRCYEAINKKEEAIDNYEEAISLDKNFTEAKQGLQRLKG